MSDEVEYWRDEMSEIMYARGLRVGREEGAAEAWEEAIKLTCVYCGQGTPAEFRVGVWRHLTINIWTACHADYLRQRREALKKEQANP